MIPKRLILLIVLLAASRGWGAVKLVQPDDKSGDDIRAAATQFLNDLAAGKEKEVRAEFAGAGDGEKLMNRLIHCVAIFRQLQDAATAKFGDDSDLGTDGPSKDIAQYAKAISHEVIYVSDNGTTASIEPGASDLILGVDLKRVNGKWCVSYPCSLHGDDEQRVVAELDAVTQVFPAIIDRTRKGDFANVEDMADAIKQSAIEKLRAAAATQPALRKILPPDTQPDAQPQ